MLNITSIKQNYYYEGSSFHEVFDLAIKDHGDRRPNKAVAIYKDGKAKLTVLFDDGKK